jgi:hypothetical protein
MLIPCFPSRVIAGASLILGLSHAAAEPTQAVRGTFAISGYVSLRCDARVTHSADVATLASGEGRLLESCNDPSGYQVFADYSAELENATLFVDGVAVELKGQGSVVIARSRSPQRAVRTLQFDAPQSAGAASIITLRMEPASWRI